MTIWAAVIASALFVTRPAFCADPTPPVDAKSAAAYDRLKTTLATMKRIRESDAEEMKRVATPIEKKLKIRDPDGELAIKDFAVQDLVRQEIRERFAQGFRSLSAPGGRPTAPSSKGAYIQKYKEARTTRLLIR